MVAQEERNNLKGIIGTVLIHSAILLACYFFYINTQIPKEEIETGGIVINYGTSDEGMGTDYTSTEEPAIGETINNTPVVDPNRPNSPVTDNSSSTDKDILTQTTEDAPTLNDKNPTTSNAINTNSTEKPVDNSPKVDTRALFKGKKNNGTGAGDGTGTKPGNQGKPDGDPNSNSYVGDGSGGNGFAMKGLDGRKFTSLPKIKDDGQISGKIYVDITVDRLGNIITAKAGGRGTTISNVALWEKCENSVLGCKLNALPSAPEVQGGSIIFTFKNN